MALLGAFVIRILLAAGVDLSGLPGFVAYNFVLFNVLLAIFNFIPVPPLDGSALLYRFLSPRQAWQVRPFLTQYGIFIVLGVVLLLSRQLGGLIYGITDVLVGA
jgi:Zn-dependent protease